MELGSVPITVTFDERFIRPLFGNDLMSLLIAKIDSDNMRLELELNKMMREDNHKPIDGLYMMQNEYYLPEQLFDKTL